MTAPIVLALACYITIAMPNSERAVFTGNCSVRVRELQNLADNIVERSAVVHAEITHFALLRAVFCIRQLCPESLGEPTVLLTAVVNL